MLKKASSRKARRLAKPNKKKAVKATAKKKNPILIPTVYEEEDKKSLPDFSIQPIPEEIGPLHSEGAEEDKDFEEEFIEEFHDEPVEDEEEEHENFKDLMGEREYDDLFDNPEEEDSFEEEDEEGY